MMPLQPTYECSICKKLFFKKQLFYPSITFTLTDKEGIKITRKYKAHLPICTGKDCYAIWSEKIKQNYQRDMKG